ncbi:hypothetical protein [Dyadobacter sp. CY356]|uniref:hypothetical protein n=1 Tax=Dyadobacter sp. CY356 TaxID=2906442 RepID=UPI001F38EE6E|nr:hypothetical protein [Dyadobacter sp. CY356]MCF0055406.1 hypothetical protein [Dyadobacter sp. CY356]
MKTHILFLAFLFLTLHVLAQNENIELDPIYRVAAHDNSIKRIEIRKGEDISIDFSVNSILIKKSSGLLFLSSAPLIGQSVKTENTMLRKYTPINFSITAGLAYLNLFGNKKRRKPGINIKQFNSKGDLLNSEWLKGRNKGNSLEFIFDKNILQDGYLEIAINNPAKKAIVVRSEINSKFSGKGIVIVGDSLPHTNSEIPNEPIDGGTFGEVVIIGTTENGDFSFEADYEASLGPSGTWTVDVAPGSSGDGAPGGEPAGADPGPEEKAIVRELNKIQANKCEARYIIEHAISDPFIGPSLYINKQTVEDYLDDHNLGAGNTDGGSVENAFKHAFFAALNYCSLGSQNAQAMADLHEICDGVNMNPGESNEQWFMDDYNNTEGFEIAHSVGCNEADILAAVWDEYEHGGLHDINGNGTYQ